MLHKKNFNHKGKQKKVANGAPKKINEKISAMHILHNCCNQGDITIKVVKVKILRGIIRGFKDRRL